MKALTFLEYFNKQVGWHDSDLRLSEYAILQNCLRYKDFVNQPLKKDEIEIIFKGIIRDEVHKNFFRLDVKGKKKYRIKFGFTDRFVIHNDTYMISDTNAPTTLNDFIGDCQRAGIELTFKEEIAKLF